jgi:hypothetical protein
MEGLHPQKETRVCYVSHQSKPILYFLGLFERQFQLLRFCSETVNDELERTCKQVIVARLRPGRAGDIHETAVLTARSQHSLSTSSNECIPF